MELTQEVVDYIENRMVDYQRRYDIKVLYWFIRKSTLKGLSRQTSDLDVAFVFQNIGKQPRKIIFERSDRRNEFQCWNIEEILEIIVENKKRALESVDFEVYNKNSMYTHYVLDYYNGFYCSFGSELKKSYCGFMNQCEKSFWVLYEPLVVVKLCMQDMSAQLNAAKKGYFLSLNQYLNAIWSGLTALHCLEGGQPGKVNIGILAKEYLTKEETLFIDKLVLHFRKTIQKQSNYCNLNEGTRVLCHLNDLIHDALVQYQTRRIELEPEINNIKMFLQNGDKDETESS